MTKCPTQSTRIRTLGSSGAFSGGPRIEPAHTILVVEDDSVTRKSISRTLQRSGFEVREAVDGEAALTLFVSHPPRVVILDIGLPGVDGFEVCRSMRGLRRDAAILMLTIRCSEADKIRALDLGADDYMVKPFNPGELVARIKALLRRFDPAASRSDALIHENIRVDFNSRKVFLGGAGIDLTPREFALLVTFLQNPGKVLTRDELFERIWGKDHHASPKGLDVYVRRLREKTEEDPSRPKRLMTARGVGYMCAPPREREGNS